LIAYCAFTAALVWASGAAFDACAEGAASGCIVHERPSTIEPAQKTKTVSVAR
jgi:hypothetical protein